MEIAVDEGKVAGEDQVVLELAVDDDGYGKRGRDFVRMALIGGEGAGEGGETGDAGGRRARAHGTRGCGLSEGGCGGWRRGWEGLWKMSEA